MDNTYDENGLTLEEHEKTYTCFLDGEPTWSCEDLGALIAHIQHSMDDCLMAAVGGKNIFQGKARHSGRSFLIEIRDTTIDQQEESEGE